jgi:hypothetical protein
MIRALLILNDAPLMSVIMYILLNKWSGLKNQKANLRAHLLTFT